MKRYRLVTQQDEWGCGVSCVASILGLRYIEAKRRLEKYKKGQIDAKPKGLELEPIIKVLFDAGIKVTKEYGRNRWPIGTIVFLSPDWGRYEGSGHYLVKTPNGWMDPWFNMARLASRPAKFRSRLPTKTEVQAALIPKLS